MANPNLTSATAIYGKTVGAVLTTSSADILTNSAASGKVYKVNAIYAANIDGTDNVSVTIGVYDASATATYYLAYTMTLPADTTLDILSKSIYLEEGDKITGLASAASDANLVISYEDIS